MRLTRCYLLDLERERNSIPEIVRRRSCEIDQADECGNSQRREIDSDLRAPNPHCLGSGEILPGDIVHGVSPPVWMAGSYACPFTNLPTRVLAARIRSEHKISGLWSGEFF